MQNPNKILQIAGTAKSKLFDNLIKALVKATYLFGFTYKQFTESYEKGLIAEGKHKGMSITEISNTTGLDRRRVSSMINIEKIPKQRQSVRFTILLKLYEYQKNTNKGKPIFIEHFNRIVRQYRDGNIVTSPELFLKLICSQSVGCAINLEKHINILSPCLNKITDLDTLLVIFSENTNRLMDTINFNVSSPEMKLFERLTVSTRIPTEQRDDVNNKINVILFKSLKHVKSVLIDHEVNVKLGTYPEIGAHIFQFFQQHKKEATHEKHIKSNNTVNIDKHHPSG